MDNLKDQVVIITGGGSGMGAATARIMAAQGAKVALLDVNQEKTGALAKELGGIAQHCDVTDEQSAEIAVNVVTSQLGAPRVLVNCAGILIGKRILGKEGPADLAHFSKVLQVNVAGTFNMMRLVAAQMSKLDPVSDSGERGVIVNTASIAAYEGQIGQAAYSASKGAIVSLTLPAARELARFGIRVMTIAPGAVETPMIGQVPDDIRAGIEAGIPFPSRFAKPEEFAKLALHITQNEMLNGEVIRLDGASRLTPK